MARFAKFGKRNEKPTLSASKLPAITPAYTKVETNKKVAVPKNVSRQIVNGAADALAN